MASEVDNLDADVSALGDRLGTPIPDYLRSLFRQGPAEDGPGHLMTPTEVARDYELIQQTGINWRGCCPIWTDDNSNYAALYLTGPLYGKVCFLDHEEPDLSPAYRRLSSFLAALKVAKNDDKDWYEMPTDYPIPTDFYFHQNGQPAPVTESEVGSDLEIVAALRSRLDELPATDDDERRYLCFCIIGLTPPNNLHAVLEFLVDEDMWIQERAANVLGFRAFEPAAPQLAQIALLGTGNGVSAAMSALGRIGSADCRDALLKCLPARGAGYAPYLGGALRACGCEATHDLGNWRYRLPGESNWRPIN